MLLDTGLTGDEKYNISQNQCSVPQVMMLSSVPKTTSRNRGIMHSHTEINKILPLSLVFIFRPEESTDVMLTSHERISTQRVVRLFSHRASILKQKHSLSDYTAVCHFSATWTGTGRWRSTAHELYIDPLLRLDEEKICWWSWGWITNGFTLWMDNLIWERYYLSLKRYNLQQHYKTILP